MPTLTFLGVEYGLFTVPLDFFLPILLQIVLMHSLMKTPPARNPYHLCPS